MTEEAKSTWELTFELYTSFLGRLYEAGTCLQVVLL